MLLFKRLLIYISSILVFVTFEILFRFQQQTFIWFLLLVIIVVFSVWKILGKGLVTKGQRWGFLITPLFLVASVFLFILFLGNYDMRRMLAAGLAFLIFVFLDNLFTYIYNQKRYQANNLENISNYFNLLSAFFGFCVLFAMKIFLNFPAFISIVLAFIVVFCLSYHVMWINRHPSKKVLSYVLVISFVLSQIFLAVLYLPTAFYINGIILTIGYYLLIGVSRAKLTDSLNNKLILKYTLVSVVILVIILVSAKWF